MKTSTLVASQPRTKVPHTPDAVLKHLIEQFGEDQEQSEPLFVHSKFRGDAERSIKVQTKLGILNKTQNNGFRLRLEFLDIDDLIPLESQRITQEQWATKRLKAQGGLDRIAFGALNVALDPNDNKYYVWDGCGRLAIAKLNGAVKQVPCLIYDIAKEQAANYFAYNQMEGRRTLSKESIFVNSVYSGGSSEWVDRLRQLGLYVQGDTDMPVPHPKTKGHVEIRYRALTEGYDIAGGDMDIQRQARDTIVNAWSKTASGCNMISQDIYWAIIQAFVTYPKLRKNSLNVGFTNYLENLAIGKSQSNVKWKPKGLSGNAGVSKLLAQGMMVDFRESSFWKDQWSNDIALYKLD